MIGEQFHSSKLITGIEGHVTVELRDAASEKLQEKQETKNFISLSGVRYLQWAQRANLFKSGISAFEGTPNGSLDKDYQPLAVNDVVVLSTLTDDNSTSGSEWTMFGKLIGYAKRTLYSGGDTLLGTPNNSTNPLLCETTPTYTKWVFDWGSSAANGTIGSIGWMSKAAAVESTGVQGNAEARFYTSCSLEEYKSTGSTSYIRIARKDANTYFLSAASSTSIIVTDQNFSQTSTIQTSSQFKASTTLTGLAWDGTNNRLWVLGVNASNQKIIAAYNMDGSVAVGPISLANQSKTYASLTYDSGTNTLWTLAGVNNNTFAMCQIDPANGSETTSNTITLPFYTVPGTYFSGEWAYGIAYDSSKQYLYIATYASYSSAEHGTTTSINSAIRAYDRSGTEVMVPVSLRYWRPGPTSVQTTLSVTSNSDLELIDRYRILCPDSTAIRRLLLDGMGSRAPLPSPITKNAGQTLRVTYQMTYV